MSEMPAKGPPQLDSLAEWGAICERELSELEAAHRAFAEKFDRLRGLLNRLQGYIAALELPGVGYQMPRPGTCEKAPIAEEIAESPASQGHASTPLQQFEVVGEQGANATAHGGEQPDSDPGAQLLTKPKTDELKAALLKEFPAARAFYLAAKSVKPEKLADAAKEAASTVVAAYKETLDRLQTLLRSPEEGNDLLRQKARQMINQIKTFDECEVKLGSKAPQTLRETRKLLWDFIQEATQEEYREVLPDIRSNLIDWCQSNKYMPPGDFVSIEKVPGFPKDQVERVVRPGLVQIVRGKPVMISRAQVETKSGLSN